MPRSLFIFVLVAVMGAAGLWIWNLVPGPAERAAPSPAATIGGPFTLVDHHGKTVHEADFRGRHLLVFFGYTFCPDVCPTAMLNVSEAMTLIGDKADKVHALFISIDPERDTPEVMKSFVENFHPAITGLTGTPEQVKVAANSYRVRYGKEKAEGGPKDDYLMFHSASILLMDGKGEFLRAFRHDTTPEEMAKKVREFL
ncbi:MAG: SCO family protein [Proteobacteria bacterium]|nr:SCO family protein [Pseudomonadota bacterium]MDA1023698.1 SCO family protein [Pseudomonadota bacterium]